MTVRRDLYLGVDVGTTGLKVAVVDGGGACRATGRAEYALDAPRDGWAEQPAEAWWQAFEAALSQALASLDGRRIAALSVVGQGPTAVAVDKAGRPLRPAITWADRRSAEEAVWLSRALGDTEVNIEFEVLPRIIWIRNHEPEVMARVRWFFQPFDYLAFALTGEPVTVWPLPSLPPWTDSALDAAGLDRTLFPERSLPPGKVIGPVRPQLASRLGLSPDALVVSGTVDAFSHWVGVDLAQQGRLLDIGGTSEGVSLASDERLHDPQWRVFPLPNLFGRGWIVGGAMSNSGGLLDWAVRILRDRDVSRASLLDEIERIPPGSGGVLALPYFQGERTPIYDAAARGCFLGVTMKHGVPHLARALLEGVAFGLRQIMEILDELGGHTSEITVSGGTAHAAIWNRIKADVTAKPVRVPVMKDSGVLGAAILARSAAAGIPLTEASREMVAYAEVIQPDPNRVAEYDRIFPQFLELYEEVKDAFQRLATLTLSS